MVGVNEKFDAIPDELKERDQWMLWDSASDRKQPLGRDGYGVKGWSEKPDEWLSFDEAVSLASESESLGVGYVFANTSDHYQRGVYGFLDLDGCVTDGDRAEWLPSLKPFFDEGAFMEFSQSAAQGLEDGEEVTMQNINDGGIHIPLAGFKPPEWWSDAAADEHEGVEAYGGPRFCIFTGDTLRGCGDTVADDGDYVEEWLKEVYENITGERPWEDDGDQTPIDNHERPAGGYDTVDGMEEVFRAIDRLDARDVAEKTIVRSWNEGVGGGENEAFYPTWGSSDCNGTANIVDSDGWTDTGTDSGSGGPLEMAAIDLGEISHSGCEWGDAKGEVFGKALDHLRDLGFNIPETERSPASNEAPLAQDIEDGDISGWEAVREKYKFAEIDKDASKGPARLAAAEQLEADTDWMYVLESEQLWVYDETTGTFDRYGEAEVGRTLAEELGPYFSQSERREIIGHLRDRNQARRSELNAKEYDDPLLCVGNGVVNLRTGELKEHSPDYAFVRGLEWDYPTAENGVGADPDRLLEFLDDVTARIEDRDTLLDHLAHGLMPGHPYRAFIVCYGPGGNGKTQVSEVFRGFVGRENAAAVEIDELANDDFSTGDLPGKFINWGDDMAGDGGGTLTELTMLKKASGGSEIRANEKFEKTFDFKNEAALFFSANEPPRIGEQKSSVADRIYPIHMPYRFTPDPDPDDPYQKEKTPNISEGLLKDDAAMRGLLVLAVEHAQKLIENDGQYSQPESPNERLEKYNQSADPIVRFAGAAVMSSGPDYRIRKDDAYRVYQSFAKAWSERAAGERGFKRQLPRTFDTQVETARSRALATADDERDRVPCWKRIRWDDAAREHMPDWMVDRYSDHFDLSDVDLDLSDEPATAEGDTEDAGGRTHLVDLTPGTHAEIVATVGGRVKPKDWLADEGWLEDDSPLRPDFRVREGLDGADPFADVGVGDTVRIHNAEVKTEDDVRYVEISPKCEVEVLDQEGASASDDDGGEPAQAATDGGAATEITETGEDSPREESSDDSGESALSPERPPEDAKGNLADARRLAWILEGRTSMAKYALCKEAKKEFGMDIGRAGKVLEWVVEKKGLVHKTPDGEYRLG